MFDEASVRSHVTESSSLREKHLDVGLQFYKGNFYLKDVAEVAFVRSNCLNGTAFLLSSKRLVHQVPIRTQQWGHPHMMEIILSIGILLHCNYS